MIGRPRLKAADPLSTNAVGLNANVSAADSEVIRLAAAARGLTVSDFIRQLVIPAAETEYLAAMARDGAELL